MDLEYKKKIIAASALIVKAVMIALSENIDDDKFLTLAADLYWQVEKEPGKFASLSLIADQIEVFTSTNIDELKNHLEILEQKCSKIRERINENEY